MDDSLQHGEPSYEVLAELSALASGTLDAQRAAALRAQIAASPELSERYERELRAVQALAVVRADRAPARLRARIEAGRRQRPRVRVPRPGTAWGLAAAGALAVAAVAVVLLLPAGTPGSPSVSQAASLALRGPALPGPSSGGSVPGMTLNQAVEDVYFPDWSRRFGWSADGQRMDQLGGRKAVTVFYMRDGRQLAYTIVSAPALRMPGAQGTTRGGTEYQTFTMGQRQAVTWRRAGHTCILSGVGISPLELTQLAAAELPAAAA